MAIRAQDLHRLSVESYLELRRAHPDEFEHTELIDGVVYDVTLPSALHAAAVRWIVVALMERFGDRVWFDAGVNMPSSIWGPDICVLAEHAAITEAADSYPHATDLVLAIEVSVTSEARDLGPKLTGYAESGVPNYWVVKPDEDGWIVVHSNPSNGMYRAVERFELPSGYRDLDFKGDLGFV